MRREGRIHGNNVRVNKKESGSYERAIKPTNHSKVTGKCPANGVRCVGCSHGQPVKKSIGKVKTALKARDLDVTKNHKMAEWSFSQKQRFGEYDESIKDLIDSQHEPHSLDSDEVDEYWADNHPSPSPVLVFPIDLLLQKRKQKAVKPKPQIISSGTPESAGSAKSYEYESEYESDDDSWSTFEFSDGEEVTYAEEAAEDDWEFVMDL
jgi:hypothetical protein